MKIIIRALTVVLLGVVFTGTVLAEDLSKAVLPHIEVELLASREGLKETDVSVVAVKFTLEDGWHIYGQEPGDVGLPTVIDLYLPDGISQKALPWPKTMDFHRDGLVSHGYEGEVIIPTAISGTLDNSEMKTVQASATWVICQDECIPQEVMLEGTIAGLLDSDGTVIAGNTTVEAASADISKETTSMVSFSFLNFILLAFVGGIILNLMPCVFPVISLKILSFAGSKNSPEESLRHGWLYAAGVLSSFWVLGATFLLLRSAGHAAGWGFQFQSPVFVALMAFIVFVIALNLIGVFEIGASVQCMASRADRGTGGSGAFFSGVLSTLLATPCSAPFMASAIAATMTMAAFPAMLIFTALGMGLALPYLVLAANPRLLRFLPQPGMWMVRLKQVMAFPLFATVVWLTWVLDLQAGSDGLFQFLIGVLLLGFGCWVFGNYSGPHLSVGGRRAVHITCGAVLLAAVYVGVPFDNVPRHAEAAEVGQRYENGSKLGWEPYSAARLAELQSQNTPVLLEFTAAWCVTCQVNHGLLFHSSEVITGFKQHGVKVLIADWTNGDETVTAAIKQFGRSGVPLSVFYLPGAKEALILPQILTPGNLLEPLETLGAERSSELESDEVIATT